MTSPSYKLQSTATNLFFSGCFPSKKPPELTISGAIYSDDQTPKEIHQSFKKLLPFNKLHLIDVTITESLLEALIDLKECTELTLDRCIMSAEARTFFEQYPVKEAVICTDCMQIDPSTQRQTIFNLGITKIGEKTHLFHPKFEKGPLPDEVIKDLDGFDAISLKQQMNEAKDLLRIARILFQKAKELKKEFSSDPTTCDEIQKIESTITESITSLEYILKQDKTNLQIKALEKTLLSVRKNLTWSLNHMDLAFCDYPTRLSARAIGVSCHIRVLEKGVIEKEKSLDPEGKKIFETIKEEMTYISNVRETMNPHRGKYHKCSNKFELVEKMLIMEDRLNMIINKIKDFKNTYNI